MKALIQRVSSASVLVDGKKIAEIQKGYLVLLGIAEGDSEKDASYLSEKIVNLRLFSNDEGKFDNSIKDMNGSVLLVSQFTLLGNTSKGRRPNFQSAAKPDEAFRLYDLVRKEIIHHGIACETGVFQAHMEVALVNDGPVTLMLESK